MGSEFLAIKPQQFLNQLQIPRAEKAVLDAIKQYDQNTFLHCINVAMLTKQFMEYLHYSKNSVNMGILAALVHDAGKIGVPNEIINKPGALTAAERDLIDAHATDAPIYMDGCNDLEHLVAATHHMHYSDTDELTQIISLCDVYSANHLERAYKPMNMPAVALNNTLSSQMLNPKLLSDFETMWKKNQELVRNDAKYIKPEPSYYEQMAMYYLASKYHLNERQLSITHDPNYIIWDQKVIGILDDNGTIVGEPHEIDMLGGSKLFDHDVDWQEQDVYFPDAAAYENLILNNEER